jgi:hypothetical protein
MIVNLIILCLVIVSFVCVYKSENCDIKLKYALYSLCAIIFVIQLQKLMNNNMNENFDSTDAKEALQNIASIYNKGELTVSKLNVTGDLAVTGKSSFGGDLAVTGKSSFGDDITGAKNLTITKDVAIGNLLIIRDPAAPQGKAWQLNNYAGTLMTSSNKSGAKGAIQLVDDFCGEGTISARYLQPGGMWKMAIGTSRTPNANTYAGLLRFGQKDGRVDPDWREHSC